MAFQDTGYAWAVPHRRCTLPHEYVINYYRALWLRDVICMMMISYPEWTHSPSQLALLAYGNI